MHVSQPSAHATTVNYISYTTAEENTHDIIAAHSKTNFNKYSVQIIPDDAVKLFTSRYDWLNIDRVKELDNGLGFSPY